MSEANKNYLTELKKEHEEIGQHLEEIKGFVKTRDFYTIAVRMHAFKDGFFSHMKKERDKMHAELISAVEAKNMKLQTVTIGSFCSAMKGVEERAVRFFNKYRDKEAIEREANEFHKDFHAICEDILKKVSSEEKILYPMYERHCC